MRLETTSVDGLPMRLQYVPNRDEPALVACPACAVHEEERVDD